MMNNEKCKQCREEIRRDVIKEIHEEAGCLNCSKLYNYSKKNGNARKYTKKNGRIRQNQSKKL